MRQQSTVFLSVMAASAGSVSASVYANLVHGDGLVARTGLLALRTGTASRFVLPPSEPLRLILIGLSLIGISLLVRRWASR